MPVTTGRGDGSTDRRAHHLDMADGDGGRPVEAGQRFAEAQQGLQLPDCDTVGCGVSLCIGPPQPLVRLHQQLRRLRHPSHTQAPIAPLYRAEVSRATTPPRNHLSPALLTSLQSRELR